MKKVLKILSHILLTVLFLGYIGYQFRSDRVEPVMDVPSIDEEVTLPTG